MDIKRGQIYSVDFGDGIGSEQKGRRPAIVLQNDKGNKFAPTVIVAAITSVPTKHNLPTHLHIKKGLARESWVLTEQIFTIDKSRLGRCLGCLDNETLIALNKSISISLGLR